MSDLNPIIESKGGGYRVIATATGSTVGERAGSLFAAYSALSYAEKIKSVIRYNHATIMRLVASDDGVYYQATYVAGEYWLYWRTIDLRSGKYVTVGGDESSNISNVYIELLVLD